jgi:hypothetical protein
MEYVSCAKSAEHLSTGGVQGQGGIDIVVLGNKEGGDVAPRVTLRKGGRQGGRQAGREGGREGEKGVAE